MFSGSAIAQTTTTSGAGPGVVDPGHRRVKQVNGRETKQPDRIANGVKNGRMQTRQKKDMAAHNGHLTKAEQMGLIGCRIQSARVSIRISTSRLLSHPTSRKAERARQPSLLPNVRRGRHRPFGPNSNPISVRISVRHARKRARQPPLQEPESDAETRAGTCNTSNPPVTAQTIISPSPYEYDPIRLFR
jgi:hypothetical protein